MEESSSSDVLDGKITEIRFCLATDQEICISSNSDCPISHASQLSNPFLGLPLEAGKCESCGAAEPGKCEGHFGYIELPIPIYHPSHVGELKRILSQICLKCLKMKNTKINTKNNGKPEKAFQPCCKEASQVSIEVKTMDGAGYLELKLASRSVFREGVWDFLEKYGFSSSDYQCRPLLPSEALEILKRIPEETIGKLVKKGYFPQEGFIMQYLPVPPNCLSLPDVSDGSGVISSDVSLPMLKKVLTHIEIIRNSRSGLPNFDSLEVESNQLQVAVADYLQSRGRKVSHQKNKGYGICKGVNRPSCNKAWIEKMNTLFISKTVGFCSRSVITGDSYRGVREIGVPREIAERMTFEERVNDHNLKFLQKLVDEKRCLMYRDGSSTYSLKEGSKGKKIVLKPGQIVHRQVMEGDIVFINRPPSTHKHSLQALSVYIHNDHTFKINPLICGPLSADFDGDCIHVFYPQSLETKVEAMELFAAEKQLLSSHTGTINLHLGTDSLLALKAMFRKQFFGENEAQQLVLFALDCCLVTARSTVLELLEASLPRGFHCSGKRFLIRNSKILKLDYNRDVMSSVIDEIVTSIFFTKGPNEVLRFFDSLQPMLMESLHSEGFSLSLKDFMVPKEVLTNIQTRIQDLCSLLYCLRSSYNEVTESQLESHLQAVKNPIREFILESSSMGNLIDSRSDSSVNRIVQQIAFLGLQIMNKGHLYSRALVEDMASKFNENYPNTSKYPSEEFGLVRSSLFDGLDPYQELVHSISNREVTVRASRGLTEPGTLFKNLMAILRDVVVCHDGTVRNSISDSVVQFDYGVMCDAGEPVGALAATAMSDPAYKAVLDSSPKSNSSWEMMKEILQCDVRFKNDPIDRRVMLYLNDCDCPRDYCRERAAYMVKNHLEKVSLKDVAIEFLIEYKRRQFPDGSFGGDGHLVGHIQLNKLLLKRSEISTEQILEKCQDTLNIFRKKKKIGDFFKRVVLRSSECSFMKSSESMYVPCLEFFWQEKTDINLESTIRIFAKQICPVLLGTIIKGDPRIREANIIWITPEMTAWVRNPHNEDAKGELAIDVVVEKEAVKGSGDSWTTVLDSCLPVINLIDTTRSIPYAIKRVEDLLGISCAFEQAVQRLSTSVSTVTKGVLKEHLVLLASSMAQGGNLVGFNKQGVRTLSRTLNLQAPVTEATLYTPKNCFERAAEKWQTDPLSSIVASCSWGKRTGIGTGSHFELLWDTREIEMNQKDGVDVYDFLLMMQNGSEEESESACLGGDIESFDTEDRNIPHFFAHQTHGRGRQPPQNRPEFFTKKSSQHGPGRSNPREWKNERQVPSRQIRKRSNDGSTARGLSTANGQPMNLFTDEEQEVLSDIDPVMQSIKRIMSGYNDGVPLSAPDQFYILKNVFNFHPDKVKKMGPGVDFVMVDESEDFPGSRCFHIVTKDGRVENFSYKKCLENFIRAKYPHQADSFMAKYLKGKQQGPKNPRWNSRGRGSSPAGAPRSVSGWNRPTGGPNVAATHRRPSWNSDSRVGTHGAGTASFGRGRGSSSAPQEGGRPRSRWYMNRQNAGISQSRMAPADEGTPSTRWLRQPSIGSRGASTSQSGWNGTYSLAPGSAGTPAGSGWEL